MSVFREGASGPWMGDLAWQGRGDGSSPRLAGGIGWPAALILGAGCRDCGLRVGMRKEGHSGSGGKGTGSGWEPSEEGRKEPQVSFR